MGNIKVTQGSNLMCSQIVSKHNKAVSRARSHSAYFPQDGDDDTIQCDVWPKEHHKRSAAESERAVSVRTEC